MGTSKTVSGNVSVLSDQPPLSMGTWSPNKQNHGGLSAAHLLALNSPKFNDHMHDLSPSTQIDATKPKVPRWTDLSEADEGRLIQRIEKWMGELSRPIDFDQVNGRLLSFLAKGGSPVRSVRATPSVSPVYTTGKAYAHESLIDEETVSYVALVDDGGRPCCPYGLLRELSRYRDRAKHRDMLRVWCDEDGWLVYSKQLDRWNEFRSWQGDNRGILDIEADLKKELAEQAFRSKVQGADLAIIDAEWQLEKLNNRRNHEHHHVVESGVAGVKGEDRFSAYAQAAKTRLKRHGFTREFQPTQDHLQQDELTTWIEYLNYEYWTQDGLADKAAQCQLKYEQTLKALLDGKVLFPSEEPEFVAEDHFLSLLRSQKDRDEQAMKRAESKVAARQEALSNTKDNKRAPAKDIPLEQLQNNLKEAVESFTLIETRLRLISDFYDAGIPYKLAKKEAEKHQLRVKWALDQVPLVEAEMAGGKCATTPGETKTRRPGHEGNLDDPDSRRHEPHTPTYQEVVPAPGPPGQTHSSPSSKRSRRDVDEGDKAGPEGATTKRLKLDTQVVRGPQSVHELQEQPLSTTTLSSPLSWLSSTPILTPSSTLLNLKRTRRDNTSEEESEVPAAKKLRLDSQVVRGAQSLPESQEQALSSTPSSPLSWLSSTPILTPSSTLFSLKKTRSDDDSEEELEAPTAKRPKPNAQAVRGRQPRKEVRGTRVRQAPEGEHSEAALGNEAAREEEAQRPADPGPAAAAKRNHRAQPAASRSSRIPARVEARRLAAEDAAADVKAAEALLAAQSAAPRGKKGQPKEKPEPNSQQPANPLPGKGRSKNVQQKQAQPAKPQLGKAPVKAAPAKKTVKKAPVKISEPKKAQSKKAQPKKAQPKKAQPKKAQPKKAPVRKAPAKKPEPKKAPVKKAPAKKAPAKKAPAKKAPAKKTPMKKAQPKKAPVKKAPAKKPEPKKAPAKKTPMKKPGPKKAPVKRPETKKAQPKKAPVRKAPAKKPEPKSVQPKKPEPIRAQPQRVQPKRIPPKKA